MKPQLALVLSGGGARGAYGVGVLHYLLNEVPKQCGHPFQFEIIVGTSVGAVHSAVFAAAQDDPLELTERLCGFWQAMQFAQVLPASLMQFASIPRFLVGSGSDSGLFAPGPLSRVIATQIPWLRLRRNLRRGVVKQFAVCATELRCGKGTIFVHSARDHRIQRGVEYDELYEPLSPHHVLASASMPFIFPPVKINEHFYTDGALGLNIPIRPAFALGAKQVLAIDVIGGDTLASESSMFKRAPAFGEVLGKTLTALMRRDLREERIRAGESVFFITPRVDLGLVAGNFMRENRQHLRRSIGRALFFLLEARLFAEAELASYLLFDGAYAAELMNQGRRDAEFYLPKLLSWLGELEG